MPKGLYTLQVFRVDHEEPVFTVHDLDFTQRQGSPGHAALLGLDVSALARGLRLTITGPDGHAVTGQVTLRTSPPSAADPLFPPREGSTIPVLQGTAVIPFDGDPMTVEITAKGYQPLTLNNLRSGRTVQLELR